MCKAKGTVVSPTNCPAQVSDKTRESIETAVVNTVLVSMEIFRKAESTHWLPYELSSS